MERAERLESTDARRALRKLAAMSMLILVVCACGDAPKEQRRMPIPIPQAPPVPPPKSPSPSYAVYELTGSKALKNLQERLGPEAFAEALKLNRLSLSRALKGMTVVVPEDPLAFIQRSPFPSRSSELKALPQVVLVSLRVQAWAAYESGTLVRWGPVSSGKKTTPTPAGLYHTNWKQRQRTSTFNEEWLLTWYINVHNEWGISFHEYELPGFPESHSCIRLSPDDAEWLYRWCRTWILSKDGRDVLEEGTPVVVFGAYAWAEPRPWSLLVEEPSACSLREGELEAAWRIIREQVPPVLVPE